VNIANAALTILIQRNKIKQSLLNKTDIEIIGPQGSIISNLIQMSGYTNQWIRTLTWANPSNGFNVVCGKAYDSGNNISPQTCYTLGVNRSYNNKANQKYGYFKK
jgi:hypothetical protein